ncbi:unnamed protein product [Nesidiocoris tenuis]|uniref:Uncharacterized protein n=1 Tax=Nesidiocoris tenuis TaxID=355587 RepID=A0A6H5HP56_9HEMI|nr:unnamed protein product [Nesidiocoris tenuis]
MPSVTANDQTRLRMRSTVLHYKNSHCERTYCRHLVPSERECVKSCIANCRMIELVKECTIRSLKRKGHGSEDVPQKYQSVSLDCTSQAEGLRRLPKEPEVANSNPEREATKIVFHSCDKKIDNSTYRRRSGEISYLHFVKTATIAMVPYVTTLNFHDISNVHGQVRNWRYEISPLRRRILTTHRLLPIYYGEGRAPRDGSCCSVQFRARMIWRSSWLCRLKLQYPEPGNPSPSINDVTSRPDQHGGSFDQPPGTAQQAVGATISRIYDPRACSFV